MNDPKQTDQVTFLKTHLRYFALTPRRIAAAAALALIVLLAATVRPVGKAGAAAFGPPVVVSGDDATEPGIDIAFDGAIYVNAPAGLLSNISSASFVYRSDNGGATWIKTPPGLRANFPGGGDSDIALDPANGTVFMTDLWLGSSTVSQSTDKGQTWLANPLQGVVVQDRQWIATSGGGTVYHLTHQIPAGLVVSRSINGGVLFPLHTVAATALDQTGCICPPGTLIADGAGGLLTLTDRVGFVYSTSTGGVKFARSTDGAITFTNIVVGPAGSADTTQSFPVVANAAGSDKLYAVWLEVINNRSRVRFSKSSNWGATWTAPITLVDSGASVFPWVAARGSKVAVSLYHTDSIGAPGMMPANALWFERYLASNDNGAKFSALKTVDPIPVKKGSICTAGAACGGDRQLLDFQALTIDNNNKSNLTWARVIDVVANNSDTEIRFAKEQ